MAKKVKVFSMHPLIHDAESMVSHYKWEQLTDTFEFIWENKAPDFLIVSESVYTNHHIHNQFRKLWGKNRVLFFYGEEALKPDLNLFDYGTAFDAELHCNDRIVRLPPPQYMFADFYVADGPTDMEKAKKLLAQKRHFCNFMYSHAAEERDRIYHAVNAYKEVHSLGKHLHNTEHIPTGFEGHFKETTLLREPYKFTIAAENAQYRGYTSEKIMTAFQAHTIPIYWGNPLIAQDYNEKAFINANHYDCLEDLVERICEIDRSDRLWCEMLCQPRQTKEQIAAAEKRWQDYLDFFRKLFSQQVSEAKRIEPGSWSSHYNKWFAHAKPNHSALSARGLRKIRQIWSTLK